MDVKPADLTNEKASKLTDGELWWVVTHGIEAGKMPALSDRVSESERWRIVAFVRALQGRYPQPPSLGSPVIQAQPMQTTVANRKTPQAPAAPKRYNIKGKVLSFDRKLLVATVQHEAIEGYMEAMAMPFPLKDARAAETLKAGDLIEATLVVIADEGKWWIERVKILDKK
jgi:Cu/Ag efflux protein CusF